jgi:hypothetical protein
MATTKSYGAVLVTSGPQANVINETPICKNNLNLRKNINILGARKILETLFISKI